MDFRVERDRLVTDGPTLGRLFAGDLLLYTLELPWRENAVGVSCIPEGLYRCVIAWSNRFGRLMPRLMSVPGRSGILFHPLNEVTQTMGCIGLGMEREGNYIRDSRAAFDLFVDWLGRELKDGDVYCRVEYATADHPALPDPHTPRQFETP